MTSPPERETREAIVTGLMPSATNATCPSANEILAPPLWKLKISSLDPQLLVSFQLHVTGPSVPGETLLLLMILKPVETTFSGPVAVGVGSPDTPKPLSCSAHRQNRRVVKAVPSSIEIPRTVAGSR